MSSFPEAVQDIWERAAAGSDFGEMASIELCVETKACCDLEETESLQSGISGLGPEVCKSASSVVSELSHAFILHGVNMSPSPSLVSFLPSYHVTIILQLVFLPSWRRRAACFSYCITVLSA